MGNKRELSWNEYYELAKKYREEHGNLDIKVTYETEDGVKLGYWLAYQRRAYKARTNKINNTCAPLSDEQVKLLEELGIVWDVKIYNILNKSKTKQTIASLERRFYKYLKEYALYHKNEFETYEDVKNVTDSFFNKIEDLGKVRTK